MWQYYKHILSETRRALLVLGALLVVSAGLTPLLTIGSVSAAQITNRSLLISTGQAGATVSNTFTFTPAGTSQVQSMKFTACTTALGTCTAPAGINVQGTVGQSGFQGATAFTKDTTTAGCTTGAPNVLCITRTDTTAQTVTAHTITDTGATNQNATNCSGAANCTFFVRLTTFSDTAYTTTVDSGTVASSTTQTLTVSATVQEALTFCIGSTTIDNATSAVPLCSAITGTSLNLGTLNSSNISVSPVLVANNGDANNGLAELGTNASNGATVAYTAIQQTGTNHQGTLRVAGATCNAGTVNTDQCVNAIGATKATLTAGTENFGMTVAGINCSNVTSYTCTFSTGAYNLIRTTNYNCAGTNTYPASENNLISGTSTCSYAWDETGTSQTIASSTTVVGNEALILKFAASPNITTPTGSYTAQASFVATPTY